MKWISRLSGEAAALHFAISLTKPFRRARFVTAFTFAALLTISSYAQVGGSAMTGTVTDDSGAVIPKAQISIEDVSTGSVRTVLTDKNGFYTAPNLLPSNYEISASAQGFSTVVRDVMLTVGAQQVLNITMKVGHATSQHVEVVADAPTIQLGNATVSAVVDSNTVRELPLNGRDWTQLATLQPGITSAASLQPSASAGEQRAARGFGVQLTISGTRPQQNGYFIDGINVNDYVGGGPGSVVGASLGVDAIKEFSVLTSNYTAEYGRTSGGVVNAVTRSGGNSLHGDAYEFLRNSALNTRNYFDGPSIPEFRRNQFGGSLGGPIQKDRTFFFGDYEGLRQSLGTTTVDTVPSLDARNGLIHNDDGTTTTVTVDPSVRPYLGLWAPPNGPLLGVGNTGTFSFSGSQVVNEDFVTARIDHRFSEKDSLFGSYQYDNGVLNLPDSLNTVELGNQTKRQFATIQETHIFNPQLLNSFRLGLNRNSAISLSLTAINPLAGDPSLGAVPGQNAPGISVSGITASAGGVNSGTRVRKTINAYQFFDDVFLTKGIHNLKFGVSAELDQVNEISISQPGGAFKFGSLTSFLSNTPSSFAAGLPGTLTPRNLRQYIIGSYFQDDVRLRSNFTLNLGLRYEMSTDVTEIRDKLTSVRNIFADPSPHLGDPLFSNPTLRNFAPRIGFAWDPFKDGKTSIRSGFGIFDFLPLTFDYLSMEANSAPFFLQGSAHGLAPGAFPTGAFSLLSAGSTFRTAHIQPDPSRSYVMQWNLSVQRELASNLTATVAYVGNHGIHLPFHADDANIVLPTLTSAGYIWPSPIGSGTLLNPNIGRMDYLDWESSSSYNGLEVGMLKRMAHGFQIQGSYTWSRAIDTGSATTISDPFANSITSLLFFDRAAFRSVSDFNVSQNLVVNYIWTLPNKKSLREPIGWVTRGWQLGGIVQHSTGLPFTALIGGDPLGENSADPFDYPNRLTVPGCKSLVNPGNVNNYIKLNCFALPTPTTAIDSLCTPFAAAPGTCQNLIGNAGRNELVGPGLVNVDFSIFKNNHVKDKLNVQFRAEIFNVFNHANFAAPVANSALFDQSGTAIGGAGRITQTTTASRQIQFAIKLIW